LVNFDTGAICSFAIEIAFDHFPKALINFGRKSPKHGRKSVDEWIHYYAKENTRGRLLYNAMNEARKREYRKEDHEYFQEIKLQLRHLCINKRRKIHKSDDDKSKARVSENIFIYSKPDVRVSYIRYLQDSHNYRIGTRKIRDEYGEDIANPRTKEYPFEQAKDLFPYAVARHVHYNGYSRYPKEVPEFRWAYEYFKNFDYTTNHARNTLNFITKALPLSTNNEMTNKTGTKRDVPVRYVDGQKLMYTTARNADDKYEYGYADGASDTMALGGNAWIIESMTQRKVNIAGYHNEGTLSGPYPKGSRSEAV